MTVVITLALLSIWNISFSNASQTTKSDRCDKDSLKNIIEKEYNSHKLSHKWKAVEGAITLDIKQCLLNKLYNLNSVQVVDRKTIIFDNIRYKLLSRGIFTAPASDHGYAIVFGSDQSETMKPRSKKLIKFSFSVYPSGSVNFINIFQLDLGVKDQVSFVEIDPKGNKIKPKECIACHVKSGNKNLIFDNYKKIID